MKTIFDYIQSNWIWIAPILYELAVRLIPTTSKYYSLISIADRLFPNLKKGGGTHLLIIGLLSLATICNAQNNVTAKGFFSYNVNDTAFIKATRDHLQLLYGNTGGLMYNKSQNKWRVWSGICPDTSQHNGCWVDLLSKSDNGINTANNGLTRTGFNVQLGGPLVKDTEINGSFALQFGDILSSLTSFDVEANQVKLGNVIASTPVSTYGSTVISAHDAGQTTNASIFGNMNSGNRQLLIISSSAFNPPPLDPIAIDWDGIPRGNLTSYITHGNDASAQFLLDVNNAIGLHIINSSEDLDINPSIITYSMLNIHSNKSLPITQIVKRIDNLNGFDHTGALIDLQNLSNATGDIIKVTNLSGTVFELSSKNELLINGSAGTTGQFLTSGGPGASLTWTSGGGGTPGGASGDLQYNGGGTFAGDNQFHLVNVGTSNPILQLNNSFSTTIAKLSYQQYRIDNSAGGGSFTLYQNNLINGTVNTASANEVGFTVSGTTNSRTSNLFVSYNNSGTPIDFWLTRQGASGGSPTLVNIQFMPTSSAGLPSGTLWNNSGVVNIVP